jgi:hypothetical protein
VLGAVKRDFEESFGLGVGGGLAEDAGMDDCLNFIRREEEVRRCLDGEEVGALLPDGGGLSCGGLAGRLLESRAHGAVMFSVAAAAGREIRLRWGRGEERRDDRKDEEQQQRDG